MTTKITREQLAVLQDIYDFQTSVCEGPLWVARCQPPRLDLAKVLEGTELEYATQLEEDIREAALVVAALCNPPRKTLSTIAEKALGTANSNNADFLYFMWSLAYSVHQVALRLPYVKNMVRFFAQHFEPEYDAKKLDAAVDAVNELSQIVQQWEEVAEQQFADTGSVWPFKFREATK
ncbi:MAG: hypothetical protein E7I43_07235 [Actinomyces sp.]|nr:hypothetical protein [Actinomyces sp.]